MYRIEEKALEKAFLANTKDYNVPQKQLIHQLSQFITGVIQDDTCLQGKSHGDTEGEYLRDVMCETIMAYVPIPVAESLVKKGLLTDGKKYDFRGSYGKVYYMTVNGNQSIIKIPKEFDPENIQEIFVNLIIINSLLLNDLFESQYIYQKPIHEVFCQTYGIFVCPTPSPKSPQPMYSMCYGNKPSVMMIQERISGKTYTKVLEDTTNKITLKHFKNHVRDLFTALIVLSESPYQLSHNDLHTDNVMLRTNGEVTILDYGMAAFSIETSKNVRTSYQPNMFDDYLGKKTHPLVTGAVDFFQFFNNVIDLTRKSKPNSERGRIYMWCNEIMKHFSIQFINEKGEPIFNLMMYENKIDKFFLFDILEHIERKNKATRSQHIDTLRMFTYRTIASMFFNDLMDWYTIDIIVFNTHFILPLKPNHLNTPKSPQKNKNPRISKHKKIRISSRKKSSGCTCNVIIKTGVHKGNQCGRPCKNGNKCGIHA